MIDRLCNGHKFRTERPRACNICNRLAIERDVVTVFIPEYVVGKWWEHLLHNQSALRLKGRLLFEPQVMVTSVPWQLSSSDRLKHLLPQSAPGDARRGFLD